MTYDTRTPAQRRISRALGLLALLGLAVAVYAGVGLATGGGAVDGGKLDLPGEARVVLAAGDHRLFVVTNAGGGTGDSCRDDVVEEIAREARFTVTRDGERIPVRRAGCRAEEPLGGDEAYSMRVFTADRAGTYVVKAAAAPTLGQGRGHVAAGGSVLALILLAVAGGLLAFGAFFLKLARY